MIALEKKARKKVEKRIRDRYVKDKWKHVLYVVSDETYEGFL